MFSRLHNAWARAFEGHYSSSDSGGRTRMFCVGTAKSGTHSIAALFDSPVRSKHEVENSELLKKILALSAGNLSNGELGRYIRQRDRRLALDVDSSQLNFFLLEAILEQFRTARFLLTIRDPYSWLSSFINDSLRRQTTENWMRLRDLRFRANLFTHPSEEQILKQHGLYTLDGYLSYWAMHNDKVLSLVPADRLLVVRTDEITRRAYEIADFAGLSRSYVRPERSHEFKNPKEFGVLEKIDRSYLENKISSHCRPLMLRFFPEIQLAASGLVLPSSISAALRTIPVSAGAVS